MFRLKTLPLTISTIVLISLIVGWGISMVLAWTEPSASPPGGNVFAPINVSSTGQIKTGPFGARINAIYITSGTFGTETGGGNYSFPDDLGIGITAPNYPLHIDRPLAGSTVYLQMTQDGTGSGVADGLLIGVSADEKVYIMNKENTDMIFRTNNANRVTIDNTGNVGIGTTSPDELLHLEASLPFIELKQTATAGGQEIGIKYSDKWGQEHIQLVSDLANDAEGGAYDSRFHIKTVVDGGAMTERFTIDESGNVGIGTTGPGYKLDIQGGQINSSGGLCIAGDCKLNWGEVTGLQGGGTLNYVSKFTASGTLGNSQIFDDGSSVGIGTAGPAHDFTLATGKIMYGTIMPSNRTAIGPEYNILYNATNRYTVSQSGPATLNLTTLFDGKYVPSYSTDGPYDANPQIITIENLPSIHTQSGAWVGWTTRAWGPKRFKIEGWDVYPATDLWRTIADYSSTDYSDPNNFLIKIPTSGSYTKLRLTIYQATGSAGGNGYPRLGIAELFFIHEEANRPYSGMLPSSMWEVAGNVGIGTTGPSGKLHVNDGAVIIDKDYGIRGDSINAGARNYIWGLTNTYPDYGISYYEGSPDYFAFHLGSPTSPEMVITQSNVGIGTTSPGDWQTNADNLVISTTGHTGITIDSGTSSLGNLYFADGTTGNEAYRGFIQYNHNGDDMFIGTAGTTKVTILDSGNVGIGTTSPDTYLHSVPGMAIYGATYSGISLANDGTNDKDWLIWTNNDDLHFYESAASHGVGNDRVTFQAGGNVGIGTTDPGTRKLKVQGDAEVTGTLYAGAISGGYTGTITAANVSSGIFGDETGWGTYEFKDLGPSTLLYIDATNSRIGIGTTPASRLHITGGDNAIRGLYGRMLQSRDEWLRINDDDQGQDYHTSGIYLDGPKVATQGGLCVGCSSDPGSGNLTVANITATGTICDVNGCIAAGGGDASTLDGLDSTDFARWYGRVVTNFNSYATMPSGFYGVSGTGANGPEGSYQAMINARNLDVGFQLVGGYNTDDLWYRGWASSGGTFYPWRRIWHDGNDGSGSGLDADLLDGYSAATSSTANTIAVRNSSGDINARLFRSEYDSTNATINYIMTQIDTVSNNYIRPSTPTQLATALTSPLQTYFLRSNTSDTMSGDLTVTGNLTVGGRTFTNFGSLRTFENVAYYYNGNTINTGTIVITIGSTPNIMLDAEITIQGYGGLTECRIRGYTYTGSTTWHQPAATCISSGHSGGYTVRFGKRTSDNARVILIGTTSSGWGNYPHVLVKRVTIGYPGSGTALGNWSISIVTNESAYTSIINVVENSTFQVGKLTVGTIDPIYEIDGIEYATYVADFAGGVRMETSGIVQLNSEAKYVIDFDNLEKETDLWLFWETSNKEMDDLVVLLSPGFEGKVWYNKDGHKLTIYGDEPGEVSYRLTLPRLDDEEWENLVKE